MKIKIIRRIKSRHTSLLILRWIIGYEETRKEKTPEIKSSLEVELILADSLLLYQKKKYEMGKKILLRYSKATFVVKHYVEENGKFFVNESIIIVLFDNSFDDVLQNFYFQILIFHAFCFIYI